MPPLLLWTTANFDKPLLCWQKKQNFIQKDGAVNNLSLNFESTDGD